MKSAEVPLVVWSRGGLECKVRIEEVLNGGGIIREGALRAQSVKTNVFFVNTTLHCDVSREPLESHAHLMHVRTDDKHRHDEQRTPREKHHVCGNVTLRAGLVSCVHPPVAFKGNAIACKRKHIEPVEKYIARSMMKISTMKLVVNLRMKNLLMDGRTTSNPFWGRHARNPLRSQKNC